MAAIIGKSEVKLSELGSSMSVPDSKAAFFLLPAHDCFCSCNYVSTCSGAYSSAMNVGAEKGWASGVGRAPHQG